MSLGWLTESTILPRKRKEIEGVTSNTLVELKAVLYDTQQNAKKQRITPRIEKNPLGGKNKGVEQRIQRDLNQLREQNKDPYQELQKKAELYEKLMRGEMDDEKEVHLVDFVRKTYENLNENEEEPEPFLKIGKELVSEDMKREAERREWEQNIQQEIQEDQTRAHNKEVLDSIAEKTAPARERVKKLREMRKEKAKKRIEKIRKRAGAQ